MAETINNENQKEKGKGQPFESPPWSMVEGLMLLILFATIHAFFGRVFQTFEPLQSGRIPLELAVSNTAVLIICFVFLWSRTRNWQTLVKNIGLQITPARELARRSIKPIAIGLGALILWEIVQANVLQLLGRQARPQLVVRWLFMAQQNKQHMNMALFCFSAVVLAPIVEELIFRGFLYLPARRRYGSFRAAALISLIFAGVHAYPAGLAHLFILAMVLTWVFEACGSLAMAIFLHMLHNGVMLAAFFLYAYFH
ncbi:MAG: CPBP family intramembrane glutamic endopeptidase [Candidatus Brocadiia bacterium]